MAIQDAVNQVKNIKYSIVPVDYYEGSRSEKLKLMQRMSTSEFEFADTMRLLFDKASDTENKERTFDFSEATSIRLSDCRPSLYTQSNIFRRIQRKGG